MNQKVFKTLEYNKILEKLSSYASSEENKKKCLKLKPLTDIDKINHLQQTTKDALDRLYKDSGISFTGLCNINASLKRLEIGASLNSGELLRISSLLELAKRAKAYDRSNKDDEKSDSLSELFAD